MSEIMWQMNLYNRQDLSIDDSFNLEPTFIAVRDPNTAKQVIKWITLGNFLHKTSVLSSLATFVVPRLVPDRFNSMTVLFFGFTAVISTLFYNSSWMFDPCSKYQVEKRPEVLSVLKLRRKNDGISSGIYSVVLVRRDDYYRRLLHNFTMFCTTTRLCYVFSDCLKIIITEAAAVVQQQIPIPLI